MSTLLGEPWAALPDVAKKRAFLPLANGGVGVLDQRLTHTSAFVAACAETIWHVEREADWVRQAVLSAFSDKRFVGDLEKQVDKIHKAHEALNKEKDIKDGPLKDTYARAAKTGVPAAASVDALRSWAASIKKQRQHGLYVLLTADKLRQLDATTRTSGKGWHRGLLLSAAAPHHAATWLNALPSNWRLRMASDVFQTALREYLGLTTEPGSDKLRCACGGANVDPEHAHKCSAVDQFREIHDAVVRSLADAINASEAKCTVETMPDQRHGRQRPDIVIKHRPNSDGRPMFLEVTCTSQFRNPQTYQKALVNPAVAVADAQQKKHGKYKELIAKSNAQLLVFAFENSGAKSKDALNFLALLDKWLRGRTPPGYVASWTAPTPCIYARQCIDIAGEGPPPLHDGYGTRPDSQH